MAEIHIQEKKRRTVWPWLLLLLIPLLWLGLRDRGERDNTAANTDTSAAYTGTAAGTVAPSTTGGALAAFTTYVAQTDATRDEEGQHQYTAEGVRRLAAAIQEASPTADARKLAQMRALADSLQMTPRGDDRHAEMARTAFTAAAAEIARIPNAQRTNELRGAATAVSPGEHLLAQREKIDRFFDGARAALEGARTAGAPTRQ